MTTPVGPKPPEPPKQPETTKDRITRMRANSKTLTPQQIKDMMEIKKKEKK